MPVNESVLKRVLRNGNNLYQNLSIHPDSQVEHELEQCFQDTINLMRNQATKQDVIKMILEQSIWNQHSVYGPQKDVIYKRSCSNPQAGDVVGIELGYNLGNEESFYHMAIITADFPGVCAIVPITSRYDRSGNDKLDTYDDITAHSTTEMKKESFSNLSNDSLILVGQLRVVSKSRLRKMYGWDIRGTETYLVLQKKIAELYAPDLLPQVEVLHEKLGQLEKAVDLLFEEFSSMDRLPDQLHTAMENVKTQFKEVAATKSSMNPPKKVD
ncbi:MAG TPA: hypothetical protein VFV52_00655 [Bacilli bacterium]|nr:hypothetical protein [Bacilli bacterium]